ncbi:MAG: slipin family protein [Candidatus Obscuribacterales bacterium]|jgi:regulator of protease activity HflC (stomatin/prohibitin superfamily)|nr:slipin family protein [Candidatus Obscuribacterales bacterium]
MEVILGLFFFGLAILASSLKFVNEYDRLVVFRFGRVSGVRGPGPVLIMPIFENFKKVDMRMVTMSIPMQEVITKDNISAKTAAVCFFQVVDPFKVVTKIEDPYTATSQIAQTTLRSILGQHELDDLLTERDKINVQLQAIIDRQTEGWGIKVNAIEVKDVEIPESMQRAMARQAEAERERRAKIVAAEGELQAAESLSAAARLIATSPGAMQLRQLQTMVEVSAEKNSTLIFPIPIELLTFAAGGGANPAGVQKAVEKIQGIVQTPANSANTSNAQAIPLENKVEEKAN